MNRYFASLLAAVSITFVTCQDSKEDATKPISEKDTYKFVGEEIPFETGMEWIAYYKNQGSSGGRTELVSPYSVSDSKMLELLSSMDAVVGVAFHYGLDELGEKHIILIPVDESLELWETNDGRILVDANTGADISQSVASVWATNYKNANPSQVWFHFFGVNIFNDMASLPYFNTVEIEPAINVLTLQPQLLLVVYNDGESSLGRTEYQPGTVYDASNACPPCAVK